MTLGGILGFYVNRDALASFVSWFDSFSQVRVNFHVIVKKTQRNEAEATVMLGLKNCKTFPARIGVDSFDLL